MPDTPVSFHGFNKPSKPVLRRLPIIQLCRRPHLFLAGRVKNRIAIQCGMPLRQIPDARNNRASRKHIRQIIIAIDPNVIRLLVSCGAIGNDVAGPTIT